MPDTEFIPNDKGKPGENRGRNVSGLPSLQIGEDCRATEMG
jgi:hypothetical protein